MGRIGKIISTTINNYILSVVETRLGYKLEPYHFAPSGDDSPPLPDDKVFTVEKDGSGKYVILGNLVISQGANPGEKILYSRDSEGAVKGSIYIKNDGTIKINSGTEDVKILFNDLIDAINAIVTTGSPTTHTINGASQTALNAIKARFDNLWGD